MDRVIIKQRQQKAQCGKEMAQFLRFKKFTRSTSQVQPSKKVESMRKEKLNTKYHREHSETWGSDKGSQYRPNRSTLPFVYVSFSCQVHVASNGSMSALWKEMCGHCCTKKNVFLITSPFWKTGPACSFRTENQAELPALRTGFRLSIRKTRWLRCQILSGRIKKYKWS